MKSLVIVATLHELQGEGFLNYVADPPYPLLLEDAMIGADVVFEEAGGQRPSIAEGLADSLLGPGHYVDVDPPRGERAKYGIAEITAPSVPIDGCLESYHSLVIDAHNAREQRWLQVIEQRSFTKGVLIVGFGHSLSITFRLLDAGIGVDELRAYTPHAKLCRRHS